MKTKNPVKEKSFNLAINIVKICRLIERNEHEYVLSRQLLRSGTSVGAMVREAQNAESKKDFIHKLSISQKECNETLYWLELMNETELIEKEIFKELHSDGTEVLKILTSILVSSKNNL